MLAISDLSHFSATLKTLVTETWDFLERNYTSEESASEFFSFLCMFYSWGWTKQSEGEISRAEGSCVFESLWLDPFSDISLLGCCPSVSDMHQSTPLPSGVGHQNVAPALFPRLERNLCKLTRENTKTVGVAQLSSTDGRTVARCCGVMTAAGSTRLSRIKTKQ